LGHQVFVSHAKEDQEAASRVRALLEAEGMDCWLASRDAAARKDKAAASLQAIRDSSLVLLIFSASANASSGVLRDIERAIAYERPVLSLHLDDAVPNASLEYYLNLWQWLDASEGIEDKRDAIVAAVQEHLARATASAAWRWLDAPDGVDSKREEIVAAVRTKLAQAAASTSAYKKAAGWWRRGHRAWWIAASAAAVVVALGLGLGLGLGLAGSAGHQGTWTRLSPAGTSPPPRAGDLMVCDTSSERLIVFGGGGPSTGLNDMWAYDPAANTWSELQPSGTVPPGRCDYAAAYDPVSQRLILFGGFDGPSTYVNGEQVSDDPAADTWAYDPAANSWTELKPSGAVPPARYGAVMTYDATTRRLILFGGCVDVEDGPVLNDTWAYDPAANTWAELKPAGTLPSTRGVHAMVYDPSTQRLIMFGGMDENTGSSINDTWAYDPTADTWTELSPSRPVPPARNSHAMVYDPSTQRIILFGGATANGSKYFNDTWAYDSAANTWTELEPSGTLPGARFFPSRAYASSTGQIVIFGGKSVNGQDLNDTWAFTP
jgi:N-acetylneuraminic acid mutarotase